VPDATGLELLAQDLREAHGDDVVVDTLHFRDKATLAIAPPRIGEVLEFLRDRGFRFLASVHGVDYYPDEPRLGMHYEMLDMHEVDRLTVKLRVPTADPRVPSVTPRWPTADHQEREAYDMFGVIFEGHPNLERILMPTDYEGFPQRRDFPVGGEPILFTEHAAQGTDYTLGTNVAHPEKLATTGEQ
jgi:NADH-quinone oxidoreductase subunit C